MAQDLIRQGGKVAIQWVPGHQGIPGNEKADQAAKAAAGKAPRALDRSLSLAYTRWSCTEASQIQRQEWLREALAGRSPRAQQTYQARKGWSLDQVAAAAPKQLARRYYQLKVGHAAVATHLYRVGGQDSPKCRNCQALQETAGHLLVECRQWCRQRVTLYKALAKGRRTTTRTRRSSPRELPFQGPESN
jgi:hypothetical protein